MTTAAKAVIIIFVCVSILVLTAIGVGFYWWSHNKEKLVEGVKKSYEDGSGFGKSTDNQGCLNEVLSRHKRDHGFSSSISQGLWIRACLEASRPTQGFCEGVPGPNEFMKGAQWQVRRCKEAGLSDQYCAQIFAQVQQYCEAARRKSP